MRLIAPLLLCASLAASAGARADDLLGLYVGAGAGQSTLHQDVYQVDAHATGWKVLAGWRPLSVVGAEIEYANLGSKNVTYQSLGTQVSTDAHATALFALGYLPVPLPWFDLYGKLGAARVQANTKVSCYFGSACTPFVIDDSSRTSIAWGAGAQFKLGLPAVRVEYERFSGSQGNDSLLTAALTLNF